MRKSILLSSCLVLALGTFPTARADEKMVPAELLQGLKDKDPAVRVKTIMALSKLGAEAVPPLVDALKRLPTVCDWCGPKPRAWSRP